LNLDPIGSGSRPGLIGFCPGDLEWAPVQTKSRSHNFKEGMEGSIAAVWGTLDLQYGPWLRSLLKEKEWLPGRILRRIGGNVEVDDPSWLAKMSTSTLGISFGSPRDRWGQASGRPSLAPHITM